MTLTAQGVPVPFIMAVRARAPLHSRRFRDRLANDADAETKTALTEIDRMAVSGSDILP